MQLVKGAIEKVETAGQASLRELGKSLVFTPPQSKTI
ncbi:hypothetical protein ABIA55_002256 [Pseudomonas frederiksbergensis]